MDTICLYVMLRAGMTSDRRLPTTNILRQNVILKMPQKNLMKLRRYSTNWHPNGQSYQDFKHKQGAKQIKQIVSILSEKFDKKVTRSKC